ncbi:MAG: mechanosensitive ion channel protein MscS [Bacillales bacterium]|jgi:small conductance mechanosensitive channel|nr:mechanosensitive ion channel protein MscS [Bacillales bacterium]
MGNFASEIEGYKNKLFSEDNWFALGEAILKIIVVLLIAKIVSKMLKSVIRKFFNIKSKSPLTMTIRREQTLVKLLENVVTYVVGFITFVTVLSIVGIDIAPILAGAGVLGLAIGFGAQNLVKDVITGFFIIFEDQFAVGDKVKINGFEGTVEEIGLRTTKIKGENDERHIIPNGSIVQVTNMSVHQPEMGK